MKATVTRDCAYSKSKERIRWSTVNATAEPTKIKVIHTSIDKSNRLCIKEKAWHAKSLKHFSTSVATKHRKLLHTIRILTLSYILQNSESIWIYDRSGAKFRENFEQHLLLLTRSESRVSFRGNSLRELSLIKLRSSCLISHYRILWNGLFRSAEDRWTHESTTSRQRLQILKTRHHKLIVSMLQYRGIRSTSHNKPLHMKLGLSRNRPGILGLPSFRKIISDRMGDKGSFRDSRGPGPKSSAGPLFENCCCRNHSWFHFFMFFSYA